MFQNRYRSIIHVAHKTLYDVLLSNYTLFNINSAIKNKIRRKISDIEYQIRYGNSL